MPPHPSSEVANPGSRAPHILHPGEACLGNGSKIAAKRRGRNVLASLRSGHVAASSLGEEETAGPCGAGSCPPDTARSPDVAACHCGGRRRGEHRVRGGWRRPPVERVWLGESAELMITEIPQRQGRHNVGVVQPCLCLPTYQLCSQSRRRAPVRSAGEYADASLLTDVSLSPIDDDSKYSAVWLRGASGGARRRSPLMVVVVGWACA